jgi:hypothetical protein
VRVSGLPWRSLCPLLVFLVEPTELCIEPSAPASRSFLSVMADTRARDHKGVRSVRGRLRFLCH